MLSEESDVQTVYILNPSENGNAKAIHLFFMEFCSGESEPIIFTSLENLGAFQQFLDERYDMYHCEDSDSLVIEPDHLLSVIRAKKDCPSCGALVTPDPQGKCPSCRQCVDRCSI